MKIIILTIATHPIPKERSDKKMQSKTEMTAEQRNELLVTLLEYVKACCKSGNSAHIAALPNIVEALLRFAR